MWGVLAGQVGTMNTMAVYLGLFIIANVVQGFLSTALSHGRRTRTLLSAAAQQPTFLICPGFGNDAKDYKNPLGRGEEYSFVNALEKRGLDAEVVEIGRLEWLKLLGPSAIQPLKFANNEMTPDILYGFYLNRVRSQVKKLAAEEKKVVLVGHSAGGWLVRKIVGESDNVLGLISLGTPHFPAVANDATRGALRSYDEEYPGSYFKKEQGKFYISVGGTAVKADLSAEKGDPAFYANNAYLAVTGVEINDGRVGDGVVPLDFTLLDGSKQIVLDCYHSIQAPEDNWYGGDGVVDRWLPAVKQEIRRAGASSGGEKREGKASIIEDGLGPWATETFGEGAMKVLGLVSLTPYLAFALKAVGAL